MAGVDGDGFIRALRARLREAGPDGRPRSSWGRPQLLELLDELEEAHTPDEDADAATLRRFAGALTDTFREVLPTIPTDDPLGVDDLTQTSAAMDVRRGHSIPVGGTHDRSDDRSPEAAFARTGA